MIYECLINTKDKKFVIAKPIGWEWGHSEKRKPFEMDFTGDLSPSDEDYPITLNTSWGDIVVNVFQIDPRLVNKAFE